MTATDALARIAAALETANMIAFADHIARTAGRELGDWLTEDITAMNDLRDAMNDLRDAIAARMAPEPPAAVKEPKQINWRGEPNHCQVARDIPAPFGSGNHWAEICPDDTNGTWEWGVMSRETQRTVVSGNTATEELAKQRVAEWCAANG